MDDGNREILLTGATGFVGRSLYPSLAAAGYRVRCASRTPHRARKHWPDRHWVEMDVDDPASVRRALDGCQGAFYLVHQMADSSTYEEEEAKAAMTFVDSATTLGVERIVYLGGLKPSGEPKRHLRSRLVTGAILRSAEVSTVELRASMVIGYGSTSWQIVRDIARRLPLMLCPRWLRNKTEPVAIDDAVVALMAALELDVRGSQWFAIPGPEALTFQECIERAARAMGRNPVMIDIPVLSPRISSYWLRVVTGANYHVARALAEGLKDDLLADSDEYWDLIGHHQRIGYNQAVHNALRAENEPGWRRRSDERRRQSRGDRRHRP